MTTESLPKDDIIDVAAEVIRSKGYQSTSVNDILAAANIGKGKFFHYFKTKHELGIAVVDRYIETWSLTLIENILRSSQQAEDRLQAMLNQTLEFYQDTNVKKGCPFGNLAVEMSEHDSAFRSKIDTFFDDWTVALGDTLSEIESIKSPYSYAQYMISTIEGSILLAKVKQSNEPLNNSITILKNATLPHKE